MAAAASAFLGHAAANLFTGRQDKFVQLYDMKTAVDAIDCRWPFSSA